MQIRRHDIEVCRKRRPDEGEVGLDKRLRRGCAPVHPYLGASVQPFGPRASEGLDAVYVTGPRTERVEGDPPQVGSGASEGGGAVGVVLLRARHPWSELIRPTEERFVRLDVEWPRYGHIAGIAYARGPEALTPERLVRVCRRATAQYPPALVGRQPNVLAEQALSECLG